MSPNTTYYYKVCGIKGSNGNFSYGKFTKAFSAKTDATPPAPVTGISISTAGDKPTITWNAVPGASGYEVQRSINNKAFKTAKNLTGSLYTDTKKVTATTSYGYRVRAYAKAGSKKLYGDWSDTVVASASASVSSDLSAPTNFNAISALRRKVQFTWDAVAGAKGYEIQQGTDINKLKKAATTSKNSYRSKTQKPAVPYYYRVRAYKTVGGKKVYSDYSPIITVNVI